MAPQSANGPAHHNLSQCKALLFALLYVEGTLSTYMETKYVNLFSGQFVYGVPSGSMAILKVPPKHALRPLTRIYALL